VVCITAPDELILSRYCGAAAYAEQQIMDRGGDVSYDASEMSEVANATFASSAHMQLANLDPEVEEEAERVAPALAITMRLPRRRRCCITSETSALDPRRRSQASGQ